MWFRSRYICALDIGTTKISCLVARVTSTNSLHIVASGYAQAYGIKYGVVENLNEAANSIKDAVVMAEENFGRRIDSVIVNVSSPALKSQYCEAEITLSENKTVTSSDMKKVVDAAIAKIDTSQQEILHQIPVCYTRNDQDEDLNPLGLTATKLKVKVLVITAPLHQIRDLTHALERYSIKIIAKVATPLADSLAVLSPEEKKAGAIVVDLGGGLTSIAVFMDNFVHYVGTLPLGAQLITTDISKVLKTSLTDAEYLKTMKGSTLLAPQDNKTPIEVSVLGNGNFMPTTKTISRALLIRIIVSRVEEMLTLLVQHIRNQDIPPLSTERIVFCGGGSELTGLYDKASSMLQVPVFLGKPSFIRGLPNTPPATTYSTCVGLLMYALNKRIREERQETPLKSNGFIVRILKWLYNNF